MDIYTEIIRAAQRLEAVYMARFKATGLGITPRQAIVLDFYARHDGVTQTEAVNATRIDRSTLSDIVGRLHSRGLVTKVHAKNDRRAYSISLTAAGRTALERARSIIDVANGECFSERAARVLQSSLAKVAPDSTEEASAA